MRGFFRERFWLVPPRGYAGLDWPEHARICVNCIYPIPGQTMRSSTNAGSHSGELDADDTTYQDGQAAPGDVHTQVTALHEVAHLLGLSEVNRNPATCPNVGALGCYGTTAWQRDDLMGWGSRVEHWHSWPWRNRIRYHTGVGGWRAVLTRQDPQPLGTGQRMDAGVAGPAAGRPGGVAGRDGGI